MMLSFRKNGALALGMLLPLGVGMAEGGAPMDRAHSLFNAFEVMCNLDIPNIDALTARASAMRMVALEDLSGPVAPAETLRKKSWTGPLTTGPFVLRAETLSGPKGITTACSVEGAVPDVAQFREVVIRDLRLGVPSESQNSGGSASDYWDGYVDKGSTLVIRSSPKGAAKFVQVKLLNMVKLAHQ
jgi:hypothetical protein